MPERIRQTRWRTSDGQFHDHREQAVAREKIIALGEAIREAMFDAHTERPSVDWCEDLAKHIIDKRRVLVMLVPKGKGEAT